MEKKKYSRSRNVNLAIRVSEKERDMIEQRIVQTKVTSLQAFMVKMSVNVCHHFLQMQNHPILSRMAVGMNMMQLVIKS